MGDSVEIRNEIRKAHQGSKANRCLYLGGERGIRTLGTLARTTVFETAPFNHSGTSPMTVFIRACAYRSSKTAFKKFGFLGTI